MKKLAAVLFAVFLISFNSTAVFAAEDSAEAKQAEYRELFELYLDRLAMEGVPPQIISMLWGQKVAVIKKALEMTIGDGNIVFLPVIPCSYLSDYSQMAMIEDDGKKGRNYLRPGLSLNVIKTPSAPYWIFNVKDGRLLLNKSLSHAEKLLEDSGRSPLTVAEAMSLALHSGVLKDHFLLITGSSFKYNVLSIRTSDNGPELGHIAANSSGPKWGTPSCSSRAILR
ncbi:hypothetical protein CL630_00370 [bacterium]|nr:hypothetical protein [bacterium]|tara:strand:- start:11159 stop:11836 length:678 start_codon:yes stop_codon:yes gene_type:complete